MKGIFDLFTKGIESTMSLYSTQVKSKFSKVKTISQKFTKKVRNMFKKMVNFIFGKPKSLDDYVKTSDGYLSKQLILRVALCIIIGFVLVTQFIYPFCEGRLWSATLVVNTEKFHTFTGDAKVYKSDGGDLLYIGSMTEGMPNGVGEVYEDGLMVYSGELENNVYEGTGKLYEDGVLKYEGSFSQNLFEGDGISYHSNGAVEFQGSFSQGNYLNGTEYYADGNKKYTGAFVDGKYDGYASFYNDDSDNNLYYVGNFANGMFNGSGKKYEDGEISYNGDFVDDLRHGSGTSYNVETGNTIYVGEFQNDLYANSGVLYSETTGRKIYEGSFSLGEENGAGILYSDSGTKLFEGEFYNDEIDYMQFFGLDSTAVKAAFGDEDSLDLLDDCFNLTYIKVPVSFQFSYVDLNSGTQVQNIKILGDQIVDGFQNGKTVDEIIAAQESEVYSRYSYEIGEKEALVLDQLGISYNEGDEIYSLKYNFDDHYIRAYALDVDSEILYYEVGGI